MVPPIHDGLLRVQSQRGHRDLRYYPSLITDRQIHLSKVSLSVLITIQGPLVDVSATKTQPLHISRLICC